MSISVRLDDDLVNEAKAYSKPEKRSVPKQIEYWANIGKMMIDNPDLNYDFLKESLLAKEEVELGLTTKYVRRTTRD